ncbi:MAG: BACON domain-containing protein [Vicinamibacterales bacterium]
MADAGGSGSVTVSASAAECAWTASANVAWLTVTSGASGAGNGTVAFTVAANTGAARTGTLTVGGQALTVSQAAAAPPCTFSIAPSNQSVADTSSSGSVAITASGGTCAWSASANVGWLAVSSGASGVGNGVVAFTVTANTGPARTGTLTIGGQTFTVSQAAPPPCTFSLAPTGQQFSESGGSGSTAVTASASSCAWTAIANDPWLTVTGPSSGTGSGTVAFAVAVSAGPDRTGTLTIGGQVFTVAQKHDDE